MAVQDAARTLMQIKAIINGEPGTGIHAGVDLGWAAQQLRDSLSLILAADGLVAADGSGQYATIQAAIDALGPTGGTIVVKPGEYDPATIDGLTNIQIIGCGWGTKIKNPNGSLDNCIAVVSSSNIRIANIQMDGNKANAPASKDDPGNQYVTLNGVWIDAGSDVTVEGCYIHDCYYGGVLFEGAVTGVTSQCAARFNLLLDNRDNGVFVRPDCTNIQIIGNVAKGGDYYGIGAIHSDYLTIAHNYCEDNGPTNGEGAGITLAGCRKSAVDGNICTNNALQGIKIEKTTEGGEQRSSDVLVRGNVVDGHSDNGDSGIEVLNGDNIDVTGNHIRGAWWGVHVGGADAITTTAVRVRGNTIASSVTHAVLVNSATGRNTVVADNDIDTVTNYMVWIDEPKAVVQGNRMYGGTSDGVVLSGSADGAVVLGNTINCAGNAILVVNGCVPGLVQGNIGLTTAAVTCTRVVLEQAGAGPTLCVNNVAVGTSGGEYVFDNASSRWIGMVGATYQIEGAQVAVPDLPTSDPGVAGRLYTDTGTVKVS